MDRQRLLKERVDDFSRARRWGRYHTPKNLAMAMIKEAAEIVEIFQWLTPAEAKRLTSPQRAHLADELADTYTYLFKIADAYGIDLIDAALAKMDKNERKYPLPRSRGRFVSPQRR